MTVRVHILGIIAFAMISVAPQTQSNALARPAKLKLEARIAEVKAKTTALVASARAALDVLTPEQRLSAPPAIWNVLGAVTEFKDCKRCPQMVIIPAGEFTMGSPPSEQQAEAQHRVTIAAPFAVSKFEITFDEWDACVKNGGCGGYRPEDQGWGVGKRPIINLSWENAKDYVKWLSRKTGKPYRLLSEAEWEYAARAGTVTPFSVGETLSPSQANYDGSADGGPLGGESAENDAGWKLPGQPVWPSRHARQCLGMGGGLLARRLHGAGPD
jgi:formylglycine-generating enzyme required for sulfatase activity